MQDTLVPIFGENGAIIVQYVVTLAVILALIALVVWAIRRFGGGAVGPTTRGRLPRLAIVDALTIDNKRRLVLVRRDNVEHLVLIGGPTDVVVEPSIIRQRVAQRPGQATPAQTTAAGRAALTAATVPPPPPPAPPPAPPRVPPTRAPVSAAEPAEDAIPFPPRRSPLRAGERFGLPRRDTMRSAMTTPVPAASDPLTETVAARRLTAVMKQELEPESPDASPPLDRFAAASPSPAAEPPDGPVPGYPSETHDDQETVSAFAPPAPDHHDLTLPQAGGLFDSEEAGGTRDVPLAPPSTGDEPPEAAAQPAGVSDLEKEMARLLDQISTNRQG